MAERGRFLTQAADLRDLLGSVRRVAVIGIKPESHGSAPAFYVPHYLQRVGYDVVPIPVYYPEVTEILGERVYRSLAEMPGKIDLVVLFRRSDDVAGHVDDIIAAKPVAAWMQQGIAHAVSAARLVEAGIDVVQDRCTMVDHRRLIG